MLLVGGAWFILMSMITGFMKSFIGFVIVRALCGVGGALIMPNVVALIAITCPPGKVRNISLGFFSASAPAGGYLGGIISGSFIAFHRWNWMFFFL
jgi:MFS family permease